MQDVERYLLTIERCCTSLLCSVKKELAWWGGILASGGVLYVIGSWVPQIAAKMRYEPVDCNDPAAEVVVIQASKQAADKPIVNCKFRVSPLLGLELNFVLK